MSRRESGPITRDFTCAARVRCETVAFAGRRGGTGRRAGLKIQYSRECVGSNPSAGTCFISLEEPGIQREKDM